MGNRAVSGGMMSEQGLCELHLHLYGCIRHDDLLERLLSLKTLNWDSYEASYSSAFGEPSPVRRIIEEARAGGAIDREAFRQGFIFGEADAGNFARFSAKFQLLMVGSYMKQALNGQCPWSQAIDEMLEVASSILRDQEREGLRYAEQRLRPGEDVPLDVVRSLWTRLLEFYAQTPGPLRARLAPSLPRDDPWPQWAIVRELALGPHGEFLTGLDFCHVEEGRPPKQLASFFEAFRQFNEAHPHRALALLYHVGESFDDKSLESAVRWVQEAAEAGAHRLGHAIALGVDPDRYGIHSRRELVSERRDQIRYDLAHAAGLARHGVQLDEEELQGELARLSHGPEDEHVDISYDQGALDAVRRRQDYAMERVRATGAIIEVCPASNRRIGGITDSRHHPIHRFIAQGMRVVVASDDPGVMGIRLADEVDWVVEQTGIGHEGRQALLDAAWASRSEVLSGRTAPG